MEPGPAISISLSNDSGLAASSILFVSVIRVMARNPNAGMYLRSLPVTFRRSGKTSTTLSSVDLPDSSRLSYTAGWKRNDPGAGVAIPWFHIPLSDPGKESGITDECPELAGFIKPFLCFTQIFDLEQRQ